MIITCMHGGWHKVKDLLSEIESYWTTRAEGYSEVNHKELNGMQKRAWLEVLKGQFPEKAKDEIKILDIGTGPGFFPVILAEAGYKVTAVDYTQEMLDTAKRNAGNLCERISFYKMDAQNLEFEDGSELFCFQQSVFSGVFFVDGIYIVCCRIHCVENAGQSYIRGFSSICHIAVMMIVIYCQSENQCIAACVSLSKCFVLQKLSYCIFCIFDAET